MVPGIFYKKSMQKWHWLPHQSLDPFLNGSKVAKLFINPRKKQGSNGQPGEESGYSRVQHEIK